MSDTTGSVAKLLGLAGVEVDVAEQEADGSWTVYATTAPGRRACCPDCGREAGRAKEPVSHSVRHLVVVPVQVVWAKNRYFCDGDACERATFFDGGPLVGRRGTVSGHTKDTLGYLVGDWLLPVQRAADAAGVAWHTAHRGFVEVATGAGIVVTETESDTDTSAGTGPGWAQGPRPAWAPARAPSRAGPPGRRQAPEPLRPRPGRAGR